MLSPLFPPRESVEEALLLVYTAPGKPSAAVPQNPVE